MANSYFNFKQFTVHQQNAAMKVCTDACLFGAWVAAMLQKRTVEPRAILDIGTGTGLLSLMLAQKNTSASIDAIEIDSEAAQQAQQNFEASPWKDKLVAVCGDVREMKPSKKYDLVISNPPFFQDDLKAGNIRKNLALHSTDLTFEELIKVAKASLHPDGLFAILLPYHREESFFRMAAMHGLETSEKCLVRQTARHGFFRCMALLSTNKATAIVTEITIKAPEEYSPEFLKLMKDYYLQG